MAAALTAAAATAMVAAAAVTVAATVALCRGKCSNSLTAVIADGAAGAVLPLQLLLSSGFATSAKPIYQLRLILSFPGIVLLLGRHLLSNISLLLYFSFALVPKNHLLFEFPYALL